MKIRFFLFIMHAVYILLFTAIIEAQTPSPYLPKTPASPNASELGKYGAVPVSYYSGSADISIPLYEFKCGNYVLPITLSYHGGGIKVNELATWVGLGWNLSAGGGITVRAKGKFDFTNHRLHIRSKEDLINLDLPSDNELRWVQSGSVDSEPDVYNYNFCGYSGQFVLDSNFQVHFLKNHGGLEIQCITEFIPGSWGGHWKATFIAKDQKGIKYSFNLFETTLRDDYCRGFKYNGVPPEMYDGESWCGRNTSLDEVEYTNWVLTKIELENRIDSILFSYEYEDFIYGTEYSGTLSAYNDDYIPAYSRPDRFEWQDGDNTFRRSVVSNHVPVLTSIVFSRDGSKVLFKSDLQRLDIQSTDALSEIEIWNSDRRIQVWSFNYFYFYSDFTIDDDKVGNPTNIRLKLDSLVKKSGDKTISAPPYIFKYFGDDSQEPKLPPRNSFDGYDHWGYANKSITASDAQNPVKLFPQVESGRYQDLSFICLHNACNWSLDSQRCLGNTTNAVTSFYLLNGELPSYPGGDRTPNANFAKSFSLKAIIYPTGGNTTFTYEGHKYQTVFSSTHHGSLYDDQPCGGIRIKTISSCPSGQYGYNRKEFTYENGVLFGEPYYLQPVFCNIHVNEMWVSSFIDCGIIDPTICGYNLYANSIDPLYMFGADNIGYSKVTESSQTGSIVYEYNSGKDLKNEYSYYYAHRQLDITPENTFYSRILNQNHLIYPLTLDFTAGDLTGDNHQRGTLKNITYYKTDGITPVKKEVYTYDVTPGPMIIGNRVANVETNYFINAYYLKTGKSFLSDKTEIFYENSSDSIATLKKDTIRAGYEQLKSSEIQNSNGDIIKTRYIYPNDIYCGGIHGCTPEACGLNQLYMNNRVLQPMEVLVEKNDQLIQANLTSYKTQDNSSNGIPVPYKEYAIESNVPFTKTKTTITHNTGSGLYEFTIDSKYKVKGEYECDQYGNVISYLKTDDNPISFYYGYANIYPVIEAKNVSYYVLNMAVNASCSNFQELLDEIGDMRTPQQKETWKNFNNSLRSNSLLSSTMITTYTYIPLVGITSVTDPAGIVSYYEYDAMGRLIFERDNDGNIIKQYKYHYAAKQ